MNLISFFTTMMLAFLFVFQSSYGQSSDLTHEQMRSALGQKDLAVCWTDAADRSVFNTVSDKLSNLVLIQEKGLCFLMEAKAFNTLANNDKTKVKNIIAELPIDKIAVSDGFNTKDAVLRQKGKSNAVGEKMKTEAVKEGLVK